MPPEEVVFRVRVPGPLSGFTTKHPHVKLSLWCNWQCEVVEAENAAEDQVEELRAAIAERSPFVDAFPLEGGATALALRCVDLPHDQVYSILDEQQCLAVPPTRIVEGWEVHTLVAFDGERVREVFRRVRELGREVELVTRRPLETQALLNARRIGPNALFDGLTDRQMDALLLAHRHGLYQSPRRTTAAAIAESVGLSRSTFEEHLRKAEHRVFANLMPYLELYGRGRALGDTSPLARNASDATVWGAIRAKAAVKR